jgi:hypothetical protein
MSSYRKPPRPDPEPAAYEAFVGFAARVGGEEFSVRAGERVAASHPLIRSPWRTRFVATDSTTAEREAARAALRASKEAANPIREAPLRHGAKPGHRPWSFACWRGK